MVKCVCSYNGTCKFCNPDGVVALVNGIGARFDEPGLGYMMETEFEDARSAIARADEIATAEKIARRERREKRVVMMLCDTVNRDVIFRLCRLGYDEGELLDIVRRGDGFFNKKYKTLFLRIKDLLLNERGFQCAIAPLYPDTTRNFTKRDLRKIEIIVHLVQRTDRYPILDLVCSIVARETNLFR
jgi:hypothetical protein